MAKVVLFCSATGVHGFSYLFTGRNLVESLLWVLITIAAGIWAIKICVDSFLFWGRNPVINVVETYTYNASLVPFPAITLCPKQKLDELYHASILLNQIQFR